jgi:hypothetical protein
MIILPPPEEATRITRLLHDHVRWSVFWDKRDGVWRVAEDDPTPTFTLKARTQTP